MNRLVIIGNGFDLAHGLPTSYKDFIQDYFINIKEEIVSNYRYKDGFFDIRIILTDPISPLIKKQLDAICSIKDIIDYCELLNNTQYNSQIINKCIVKNDLFMSLCQLNSTINWVDIESEFYSKLKSIITPKRTASLNFNKIGMEKEITKLNREFEDIKRLLDIYLEKIDSLYSLNLDGNPFLEYIKGVEDLEGSAINLFCEELPLKESFNLTTRLLEQDNPENLPYPILRITNYFLNFNYTNTLSKYLDHLGIFKLYQNQLHGLVNSKDNPINFGFGDEKDENYKIIENKNNNEYMTNIKSFHYFNNPNYKNLLNYIDGNKFQIFIMGHSCGLSDRTMLNTVFEHPNCISIKIFYHRREDGTDNYTEIAQNISRHFNDKKVMREKIVNKTLCQALPQIQLLRK